MGHLISSASGSVNRERCPRCLRAQSEQVNACICRWVTPVVPGVDVLILQHPMETCNPKGTARLLHLSLMGSQLLTGEEFAPEVLWEALHAPSAFGEPVHPVLLYPADSVVKTDRAAGWRNGSECIRLVVIDATWRKSRKMLHLNSPLQALPRCALTPAATSRYVIRKAHAPHQLSTLEATCAALAQLEPLEDQADKFKPLLLAMDGLMTQQRAFSRSV